MLGRLNQKISQQLIHDLVPLNLLGHLI